MRKRGKKRGLEKGNECGIEGARGERKAGRETEG